jgi:hypothetical protein
MVWGLIRIVLFTIAFVVGITVIGPFGASAGSKSFNPPRLDEHMGTSLVVACESGNVVVRHMGGTHDAVRLECAESKIVVARDPNNKKTAYYHLLGM